MMLTVHIDKQWHRLGLKKENFLDKWDAYWIDDIVEKVNNKKVSSLAIFDDIVSILGRQNANQPLWELYMKKR